MYIFQWCVQSLHFLGPFLQLQGRLPRHWRLCWTWGLSAPSDTGGKEGQSLHLGSMPWGCSSVCTRHQHLKQAQGWICQSVYPIYWYLDIDVDMYEQWIESDLHNFRQRFVLSESTSWILWTNLEEEDCVPHTAQGVKKKNFCEVTTL